MEDPRIAKAVEAIRAMSKSGMTLAEIRNSLKSMNINDSVADELVSKARVGPTPQELHEAVTALNEKLESGDHLKPVAESLQRHAAASEEVHARIADIQAAGEEHAQKLGEIGSAMSDHARAVSELHGTTRKLLEKHDELKKSFSDVQQVAEQLGEVKSLLMEMRPTLNALRDLNAKILDTNRQILLRMKK